MVISWLAMGVAQAAGFGSSIAFSPMERPGAFLPSFDIHADPVVFQFHALEFLDSLTDDRVYFGANLYFDAGRRTLKPARIDGVVQPGISVDIAAEPATLVLLGEVRLGGELTTDSGGVGIYVVPALGVGIGEPDIIPGIEDDSPFVVGGALQLSAWLGRAGG